MKKRYLQRYRLSKRQYAVGCPVVLLDGALLEDRKLKRFVAQLKFCTIDDAKLSSLTVMITNARTGEKTKFTYLDPHGREFGQYTAIELPWDDPVSIRAKVTEAVCSDGSRWELSSDSVWGVLPAHAGKYAQAADLWYCTCGEICRGEICSCGRGRPQTGEVKAPGKEKLPAERKPIKLPAFRLNKKAVLGIAAVALVTAIVVVAALMPRSPGGESSSGGSTVIEKNPSVPQPKREFVLPKVTTPTDKRTVYLELEETEEGRCRLDFEQLKAIMPEAGEFNCDNVFPVGDDIDSYLTYNYHMMDMVQKEREELYGDGWNYIFVGNEYNVSAMLVFSEPTRLCGYFIGQAEDLGNGKWEIAINLCDYDFTDLYHSLKADFEAFGLENYPYLSAEEALSCGAAYFMSGYGNYSHRMGTQTEQMFYLWSQYTQGHQDSFIYTMDRMENQLPTKDSLFYRYFLLMDENREIIGYTLFGPAWANGTDNSGSTVWDGEVATGFGGGNGIERDPYIINTAQQLAYLAECANDEDHGFGGYFKLCADIDLNGLEWTPIGGTHNNFSGVFDGGGHTISGLYISKPAVYKNGDWQRWSAGLFGSTYETEIRDLTVDGEIHLLQPDENLSDHTMYIGGIVSDGSYGRMINCHNRCDITVEDRAVEKGFVGTAGVIGNTYGGTVEGCSNSGNITVSVGRYTDVAGVVGNSSRFSVINCWNTGDITTYGLSEDAGCSAAGIAPSIYDAEMRNCCNLGDIRSFQQGGGISCYISNSDDYEGESVIENCYNAGEVSYTGPHPTWRPIGSLLCGTAENTLLRHCFYPAGGLSMLQGDGRGTEEDIGTFDAQGQLSDGGSLMQRLNDWVAERGDESFAKWSPDSRTGLPIPRG